MIHVVNIIYCRYTAFAYVVFSEGGQVITFFVLKDANVCHISQAGFPRPPFSNLLLMTLESLCFQK